MDSGVLDTLKVVEADRLRPFEMSTDEFLGRSCPAEPPIAVRHPLLVTPLEGGEYLLLDAAGWRQRFLPQLPHVPVQVVTAGSLQIMAGSLAVSGFTLEDLRRLAARYADQLSLGVDAPAEGSVPAGWLHLGIGFANGRTARVGMRHSGRLGCPPPLVEMFRQIAARGRYFPAVAGRERRKVSAARGVSAWIQLPAFRLQDLISAARSGRLFPAEIIGVVPEVRILSIDFPTHVLASSMPRREKEGFLRELVLLRRQRRHTSAFHGRVYLLNR